MTESTRAVSRAPNVLFFLGHFNDIDHIAPVAYKLAESGLGHPIVLITDPHYDIRGDYRLRYLRERWGATVESIFDFHPLVPGLGMVARLLTLPGRRASIYRTRPLPVRAFLKALYGARWARQVLDRHRPAALVFEWAQPASGITGAFVSAAHRLGIASISLPHGMRYHTNELITREEQTHGRVRREYVNLFDRAVYQSRMHAERSVEEGVNPNQIAVLGSARFCEEWHRINLEIQPEQFEPTKPVGTALKVVFILPQWNYNADFEATLGTLRRLVAEAGLHVVLKPHTRELEVTPAYLREFDSVSNVEVAGATGSVALVEWADAVIVLGSSVALEVLLQGKPHLDPIYLDENSTAFETHGAVWATRDDDELVAALHSLANGAPLPYGQQEIDRVVGQLVLGDEPQPDVLQRYVDFVLGGWRSHPTYQDILDETARVGGR